MSKKLLSKKKVSPSGGGKHGAVKLRPERQDVGFDLLREAARHWIGLSRFRRDRERNKRYCYGDQWKDRLCVEGESMTEEEYIRRQGQVPLKNNLIRRLVRNVMGTWRSQNKEPTCYARDRDEQQLGETMTGVLQYNMQLNRMEELLGRGIEEFLISGLVVHRKWYGWRNDKLDCWTDAVPPSNFFVDGNMRDFRGWDCSLVGELHDVSFEDVCGQFAQSPSDVERLRNIYRGSADRTELTALYGDTFADNGVSDLSFFVPREGNLCRVVEVWRRESKARYRCHDYNTGEVYKIELSDYEAIVAEENADRLRQAREVGMAEDDVPLIEAQWFVDSYWSYYYLAPTGEILDSGETPYAHKSHPYVFKAYPFIDGEIHSFVGDVIDQQRYVNRLISLHDLIMKTSAKNTLIVPEESLGGKMSFEEIVDEWSRPDGVIVAKTRNGTPLPQQVSGSSPSAIGISEVLNLQLKFFEDISGVNGALQGKPGFSGMSASLYSQQAQNSTTSLLELLESYSSFIREGAMKDVKNMQQFYDHVRVVNITGRSSEDIYYDPAQIRDVEFDLNITESSSTPVYRQLANDFLMEIWKAGQINLEQLLESGDFPFADSLLERIKSDKARMEAGRPAQGIPPELAAQAQQGANPDAVAKMDQLLHQS